MRRFSGWGTLYLALVGLVCPHAATAIGTPAGTHVRVEAIASYDDGFGSGCACDEALDLLVAQLAGVALRAGQPPETVDPGVTYYIPLSVANAGNGPDAIALAATSAGGWQAGFVRDDNGDGIHQKTEVTQISGTGPMAADESCSCFAAISVPYSTGSGDTIILTAVPDSDPVAGARSLVLRLPAPGAHTISFVDAPAMSPSALTSPQTAQCSATAVDSMGSRVEYSWSDAGAGGKFTPSADEQEPTYTPPAVARGTSITVTLTCTATAAYSLNSHSVASASATLTVSGKPLPGDLNADGVVDQADAAIFTQEWARWHICPPPSFDPTIDAACDLAPRTDGAWPDWDSAGDATIDINDAIAFAEAWVGSQNPSMSYDNALRIGVLSGRIYVFVDSAPYGVFAASVAVRDGATLNPAVDASGNLACVSRQSGCGKIMFSEYEPAARTVHLAGVMDSSPRGLVALIRTGTTRK